MTINKKVEIRYAPVWPTRRHNPRERKVLQTAMEYVPSVLSDWPVSDTPSGMDDALDVLAHRASALEGASRCIPVTWDLSQHGGGVGTHLVLTLSSPIPAGSVVQLVTSVTRTALTSATSSAVLSLVGLSDAPTILAGSGTLAATSLPPSPQILATALSSIQAEVSGEDLLTGKVTWYLIVLLAQ